MIYLTNSHVRALHAQIMQMTGHPISPLRAEGLLESAVLRPQNAAHYEAADLAAQATSLAIGISQNQPFLDGNKRTAYIAMLTFLDINGFKVSAKPLEIAQQLEGVAIESSSLDEATEKFAAWIRERLITLDA